MLSSVVRRVVSLRDRSLAPLQHLKPAASPALVQHLRPAASLAPVLAPAPDPRLAASLVSAPAPVRSAVVPHPRASRRRPARGVPAPVVSVGMEVPSPVEEQVLSPLDRSRARRTKLPRSRIHLPRERDSTKRQANMGLEHAHNIGFEALLTTFYITALGGHIICNPRSVMARLACWAMYIPHRKQYTYLYWRKTRSSRCSLVINCTPSPTNVVGLGKLLPRCHRWLCT